MADDPNIVFTVERLLAVARKEVGTLEEPVNKTKYGREYGHDEVKWCGIFVWWCFKHAGYDLRFHGFSDPSRTNDKEKDAAKAFGWTTITDHKDAQPGDLVIYDFDTVKDADHTGIVVSTVSHGHFDAIEGNTWSGQQGDQHEGIGVFQRNRPLSQVFGLFRPPFVTAPPMDDEMFLGGAAGTDARVFLIGVKGKRLILNPHVFDALVRCGIPYKGDVATQTLNLFPTIG